MQATEYIDGQIVDLMDGAIRDGKQRGKLYAQRCMTSWQQWARERLAISVDTMTPEQRKHVIDLLTNEAISAYDEAERARKSRPSYALQGKLTRSEQGANALLADAIATLQGARLALEVR